MYKVLWLILVLFGIWIVKLSFDLYSLENNKIAALSSSLEQQNQKIGGLYDQMIALQKQQTPMESNQQTKTTEQQLQPKADLSIVYTAQDYVVDRLQLIQSALQQQQFTVALEQIQILRQKLQLQKPLSERVNLALIEALNKDQNTITLFLQQRAEHQQVLQQELRQIEQALRPRSLDQEQQKWQWSTWFNISKADRVPNMQNRTIYFKHLQLQLLLAQQALYAGQVNFYRLQLQDIIEGLSVYPDQQARNIIASLRKLETLALSTPPQLSASALIQEN